VKLRDSLVVLVALLVTPIWGEAAGPRIALDATEIDLGEVQYGHSKSVRINISNKGDQPLDVIELRTSCGCTRTDMSDRSIAPGARAPLTVSFDATGIAAGRNTKTVFIDTNDPVQPVSEFRIFALVVQQIRVEPSNLVARLPIFQEKLKFPLTVHNGSDAPVSLRVSGTRGAVASAAQSPEHLSVDPHAKAEFSIEVVLAGQDGQKLYRGAVLLRTDHPTENPVVINTFLSFEPTDR